MGLPGSGKTTFARKLAKELSAVWFNADKVRETLSNDLGFSIECRIEQSRRMGCVCDITVESGHFAVADFVCPTIETRIAFQPVN